MLGRARRRRRGLPRGNPSMRRPTRVSGCHGHDVSILRRRCQCAVSERIGAPLRGGNSAFETAVDGGRRFALGGWRALRRRERHKLRVLARALGARWAHVATGSNQSARIARSMTCTRVAPHPSDGRGDSADEIASHHRATKTAMHAGTRGGGARPTINRQHRATVACI
ncbi:hypothetical protein MIPYR_10344 [uncultured Microbacterium sp.]|uniref:Uncharacterized protein n=1 Tax=uncultured Microbacterium sp. TaxID=191216 RepID=A0A1Y5NV10_9MICO|nr:hypothetical protein MIPYR_10344 [uncultured Microbacterium sp.]